MPHADPPPPISSMGAVRRTGLISAYLFASFALLGTAPATIGLVLLTLAFLIGFQDWRTIGRDPVATTAMVLALYVAIHSLATYLRAPADDLADAVVEAGVDWIKLLLFIPFAYWAGGHAKRIRLLLLLALVGFTLGLLRQVEWTQLDLTFFITRIDTHLPAIAVGMFSGLGALGLIALREHFWHPIPSRMPRWLRLVLWLLLLALTIEGLMLSYSRGSWIAFVVAAALLIYLELRRNRRPVSERSAHHRSRIAAAAAAAIALVILIALYHVQIGERLLVEAETIAKVSSGDLAAVPSDSTGLRVHALRFAAELWSQRPWLGWGAGSSRYLLAHSQQPELVMGDGSWLRHLHNTYAEILVQLGVVGFALAATLLWLLVRGAVVACRSGQMPGDLCRFFAASLAFVLIWNLSDYRLVRHDYNFFWIIFAGAAYSFRLRSRLEEDQKRRSARSLGDSG